MLDTIRTDRGVIRKVLRGNSDAFRVLVDRYGGMVYGIACAHVGNAVDAEDISQETFVRLYQWLDRLTTEKSVGAWLVQVARSVAVDWLRKQGRETTRSIEGSAEAPMLPNPARDELHRAIWDQLATLDAEQREILVLYYFRSKRRREIARLLGISAEAAAKRLQRARDELGRRLIDALGDDWAAQERHAARANRVMAAISVSSVAWKPSASLALSGAAIVGVSATKVVTSIALSTILIAALVYGGWRYMSRPYSTKEITAASTFEFEPTAPNVSRSPQSGTMGAGRETTPSDPSAKDNSVKPTVSTGLRVHGLLITEDRQPVAGATVTIDNYPEVEQNRRVRETAKDKPEVKEVKLTAISDREGKFNFESVQYASAVWRRAFRIWSRHGDLCVCDYLDLSPASNERYYELLMLPEAVLAGTVTDMENNPIDLAYVSVRDAQNQRGMSSMPGVSTDKRGRFTIEFLAPGSYRMAISARGFLPFDTPWVTAGDADLVFQLDAGNTISGRVVDAATGKAIPHVGVSAIMWSQYPKSASAETNETGQFTLAGLDSGTFRLAVTGVIDKFDVPYTLPEPVTVTLPPGQPVRDVELRAVMGTTVSGRVIEADTGQPPKSRVWVQAWNAPDGKKWSRGTKIGEDGRYTIQGFPPGTFTLKNLDAERKYIETEKPVTIAANMPVDGVDFSLVKLDKKTGKDKLLTGKVIDERGAPVEGANVIAVPADSSGMEGSALTDADGEFALSFPYNPPSKAYVQAFKANAMSRRAGPLAPLGNSCTLQLEPAGRIEGVVVDESGEPVSGAVVTAIGDEDAESIIKGSTMEVRARANVRGTKAATSDSGAFFMPALMAGAYALEVYAPAAAADVPVARGRAQVRAGETLRTRLVIDTQALGTIEGTVTRNGAPVPDSRIMVYGEGAEWMSFVDELTDASGHYILPHIQPGRARVEAFLMPSAPTGGDLVRHTQLVEVAAGQTVTADFNLATEKTGTTEGYVYMNGAPAYQAAIEIRAANQEEPAGKINSYTDRQGWFHVEGLEEGLYIAEARQYTQYGMAQFGARDVQEVNINAGEAARIDFHLYAGRIEGTVSGIQQGQYALVSLLDGSGNLLSLTPQVLQSMEQRLLVVMPVLKDGPFVFEGIPEGNYVLGAVAVPEDASQQDIAPALAAITAGRYAAAEVQILQGETIRVDLALP